MLFVPFVFSKSRFQGPTFRCDKIVVIVTLLEAIEGIPDKIVTFGGKKTSTIFTRDYFMGENLRVDTQREVFTTAVESEPFIGVIEWSLRAFASMRAVGVYFCEHEQ